MDWMAWKMNWGRRFLALLYRLVLEVGQREESSGGLLDLVRRRNKGISNSFSTRSNQCQTTGRMARRPGVRRGDEGDRSFETKRKRKDLPQQPEAEPAGSKNRKWMKAIQTAKFFKLNRNKGSRAVHNFKMGYYANSSRRAMYSVDQEDGQQDLGELGREGKERMLDVRNA